MSHNSPTPDPTGVDLHSIVQVARGLAHRTTRADHSIEYNNALVDLVATSTNVEHGVVRHLVFDEPRDFEVRGRIVIDYAMGFTEAEARGWFPDARWNDTDTSHAGNIETDCLQDAPEEFWHFVNLKRDVVIGLETKPQHLYEIRDEVTAVVEL